MLLVDWIVVAGFYVVLISIGLYTRKFMRGVADYLVAGRAMRKYLGYAAGGAADMGAISVVGTMEMVYVGGPAILMMGIIGLSWGIFIGKTGFVIKRVRETKVMTIPQLFEMRYSKGVRITSGVICALAGIINMGIFPIVAGRFFTYFGGLPETFYILGIAVPTIKALTAFLILVAIGFTYLGGQVTIIVTDFIQAIIMSAMFAAIGFYVYRVVSWDNVATSILASDEVELLLNPFATEGRFGLKYLVIAMLSSVAANIAWAPGMQKVISASTPKDARLIMLLKNLRIFGSAGLGYCGLAAIAVMYLPQLSNVGIAAKVAGLDAGVRDSMTAVILLARVLPAGILGLMFAAMMAAFISTNDSYLLSWAGVIVQDIICPLRKKPFAPKQHIMLLRIFVIAIGIFVYFFGVYYKPSEAIVVFQLLSGTIYIAGAGTIIAFGVYWRRGNTYGAYAALIAGAAVPILNHAFKWVGGITGGIAAYLIAITAYVVVSMLTKNPNIDLEKMLNRPPKQKTSGA